MAYIVDKEKLVEDFVNLEAQEQVELVDAVRDIDAVVEQKLIELRPKVYEDTKAELEAPVKEKYANVKAVLSKYVAKEDDNNEQVVEEEL